MTGRQKLFTGRRKCRPVKNTLNITPMHNSHDKMISRFNVGKRRIQSVDKPMYGDKC